jgi:hypothetical protein
MPVTAITPTTSSLSILFADPKSLPSLTEMRRNDAICLDLDLCRLEEDGSLGEECVSLIENAEKNDVDVILAAKTVRFYEVPGLDELAVTMVEKPEVGMTGSELADWVAVRLSKAMGLGDDRKRGLQPAKSVAGSKPGEVSAVHFESNLTKQQEDAFLHFVSGCSSQTKAAAQPARVAKKSVPAKSYTVTKKAPATKAAILKQYGVKAAAKAAKPLNLKAAASSKTKAAYASGAGPRPKAKA